MYMYLCEILPKSKALFAYDTQTNLKLFGLTSILIGLENILKVIISLFNHKAGSAMIFTTDTMKILCRFLY